MPLGKDDMHKTRDKIGMIQRRLTLPLGKDDVHKTRDGSKKISSYFAFSASHFGSQIQRVSSHSAHPCTVRV